MEKFKTVKEFCDAVKSGKNVYWSLNKMYSTFPLWVWCAFMFLNI